MLRVAFFSPLPPEPTGIGDYSFELLEELREVLEVTAVVRDDLRDSARVPDGVELIGNSAVDGRVVDCNVYQMGNNPKYHRFVYRRALEVPGLLVLHDPSLADFHSELCGTAEGAIFREEVTYDCPDIGPDDDLPLVEVGDGTKNLDRLRVLLARRIVTSNVRTLVNSEAIAIELRRRYAGCDIQAIQLPGRVVAAPPDRDANDRSVRFGVFGGINYYKRVRPTVDAFLRLREHYPSAHMVIAGRPDDRLLTAEIRRIAARPELGGALEVKTELTLEELEGEMAACDVAFSLRWPTAGEMSATLVRTFGAGRPAVVSDVLQFRELDSRYCWRVPIEPEEEAHALLEIMERAAADPERCRQAGAEARRFVEREANYKAVARRYRDHVEDCVPQLVEASRIHRPRMLRREQLLGVNVVSLGTTGESVEYAHRLADALMRCGVDAVEVEVPHDVVRVPADRRRAIDEDLAIRDELARKGASLSGARSALVGEEIEDFVVKDEKQTHLGPHDVDLFVCGQGDALALARAAFQARRRGHMVVPVVSVDVVPLPVEFSSLAFSAPDLLAPSEAAANALRVGSITRVQALPPLPARDLVPSAIERPKTETRSCSFLVHVGGKSTIAQQNPFAALRAFEAAFGAGERGSTATVILAADRLDPRSEPGRRLRVEVERLSGALVDTSGQNEFHSLLASCDVFVSLHRAEGFGLDLLDAMALGKPVIATAFLGVGEYLNHANGCPVGYEVNELDPGEYFLDRDGPVVFLKHEFWAEPDVGQGARWMGLLAENARLRSRLGMAAVGTVEHLVGLESGLLSIVEQTIAAAAEERQRIALLATTPTPTLLWPTSAEATR